MAAATAAATTIKVAFVRSKKPQQQGEKMKWTSFFLLSFALFEIIESLARSLFFAFFLCLLILLQCQKEKRDAK